MNKCNVSAIYVQSAHVCRHLLLLGDYKSGWHIKTT